MGRRKEEKREEGGEGKVGRRGRKEGRDRGREYENIHHTNESRPSSMLGKSLTTDTDLYSHPSDRVLLKFPENLI